MHWSLVVSLGLLAYLYAGYPLLIWGLSRTRGSPVRKGPYSGGVSVLIAAHNEADHLPRKLENLLALAQRESIREIWIGLDGCTDGTGKALRERIQDSEFRLQNEILQPSSTNHHLPTIRILEFETRRGKAAVLNDLMEKATQPILVMMDARQRVEEGAIPRLLENFADPQVGVVSGAMVYESAEGAAQKGAQSYWGYETFIRRCESRFWAVPGATGALYAIRRDLCGSIPDNTLVDDVLIPMRAVLKGYRCLFEPMARVLDRPTTDYGRENIRKRRTLAGIWQIIRIEPKIYSPVHNPAWFQWISHKFMRLLSPALFLWLTISAGILTWRLEAMADGAGAGWVGGLWWSLVLGAAASGVAYGAGRHFRSRVLGILGAFWGVHLALVLAAGDAWRGRLDARWTTGRL